MNQTPSQKAPIIIFVFIMLFNCSACKKFLDIAAPVTSTNQENVYQSDYTSSAVLTGLYTQMMNDFYAGGITSISLTQELAADNLSIYNTTQTGFLDWWRNSSTADYINTGGLSNFFSYSYPNIYIINAAIEGIEKSNNLTPIVKNRLIGEAYFLRSFYYFYLVNLFGDVPLILTTDYKTNEAAPRTPSIEIYRQIESDLKKSISTLDDTYVDATIKTETSERVRPNLASAYALLSRVQLYRKKFSDAENYATKVISNSELYGLVNIDSAFQKNNKETIWALQPVKQGYNTDEASFFLLTNIPGTVGLRNFTASPSLISSFEPNDKRYTSWIHQITIDGNSYFYISKYKADLNSPLTEYCIVLRLAEQYLIRAESRLEQNNINGALQDLNVIRKRAGLAEYNQTSITLIRQQIIKERRTELFTEWGHRWFDLKRSGLLDAAMTKAMSYKGGVWSSYKSVYPIPNKEILLDRNLTQNPGY